MKFQCCWAAMFIWRDGTQDVSYVRGNFIQLIKRKSFNANRLYMSNTINSARCSTDAPFITRQNLGEMFGSETKSKTHKMFHASSLSAHCAASAMMGDGSRDKV